MESLELRVFREVAHTHSISTAAKNMGYVQSNVTAHIKKLESELNTTLFIRHSKGVTLTVEGEKLLRQADQIVSLLDNTVTSFLSAPKSIKIGATQTIIGYLLPPCLIEYQRRFPNTLLSVVTPNQIEMETQLAHGQLDCIFTNASHKFSQAQQIFRAKETLMLIAPASCKTLDDIWDFPVIVNNIKSCPYRATLLNWLLSYHSLTPKITELDTIEAIISMVSKNGGISLLPQNTLYSKQGIHEFYIEELQTTSIGMWISQNRFPSEYLELKTIVEMQLHRDT